MKISFDNELGNIIHIQIELVGSDVHYMIAGPKSLTDGVITIREALVLTLLLVLELFGYFVGCFLAGTFVVLLVAGLAFLAGALVFAVLVSASVVITGVGCLVELLGAGGNS